MWFQAYRDFFLAFFAAAAASSSAKRLQFSSSTSLIFSSRILRWYLRGFRVGEMVRPAVGGGEHLQKRRVEKGQAGAGELTAPPS